MDDSKPTQRPASARASKGTVGLAVLGAALIALGNLISEVYRDSPTSSDYQTGLGMATCLAHALVVFLVVGVVSFLLFRLWDSCASVDGHAPLHWRSRLTPAQFFAVGHSSLLFRGFAGRSLTSRVRCATTRSRSPFNTGVQ